MALLHAPVRLMAAGMLAASFAVSGATPHADAASDAHRAVAVTPSRATGALGPLINIPQTWNNCGPTSVAVPPHLTVVMPPPPRDGV